MEKDINICRSDKRWGGRGKVNILAQAMALRCSPIAKGAPLGIGLYLCSLAIKWGFAVAASAPTGGRSSGLPGALP